MTSDSRRLATALADRYTIERELGQGGMATVYLAHDLKHDRRVAIKVLRAEVAESLDRERFVREIRIAARLTHPHILPLYDSGEAGDYLFFVMPVLQGQQVGVTVGTPAYMSPEQAAGDAIDGRSDLFSLGCVLFEMLTGAGPFTGATVQATIARRFIDTPPEVTSLRSDVPITVSRTVAKLLEKEPGARHATGAFVVEALRSQDNAVTPSRRTDSSVAVLPFVNMSADPDNEFFSDGITDDIIMALSRVAGLRVAARASTFTFKGKDAALATIGATLGVRTVLQGSVRRAGNRVRVTAQMMNAADDSQLWSERYDRDLDDIFAIQDEIARSIVQELELTLGLKHPSAPLVVRPTDDLQAYQLYLRGSEAAHQRSPTSLRRAIDFFRQALERDPNYARAHAGLAEAYIGLGVYQYVPTGEARREAERALAAAERLDPDLALVHVLWGQLKLYLRPDWPTAGENLAKALKLDPDLALAHAYSAYLSGLLGDWAACTAEAGRAIAADPLSMFVRAIATMGFGISGDLACDSAAALRAHDAALAIDPNAMIHLWMSAIRLGDLGRFDEAIRRTARAVELTQRGPLVVGMFGRILALAGRRADALAIRAELIERARTEYIGPSALMMVELVVGDESAIADILRRNIEAETGPAAIGTSVVRELEPLLAHPRLGPLVRQLSLYAQRPGCVPFRKDGR